MFFFFKQKTAYEMRISDWSSDVCSSDLVHRQPKQWTKAELQEVERIRMAWILSNREGRSPHYDAVKVGDKLPQRVIGPHTLVNFALEYRAHRQNIWGTRRWNAPDGVHDPAKEGAGFAKDMTYD